MPDLWQLTMSYAAAAICAAAACLAVLSRGRPQAPEAAPAAHFRGAGSFVLGSLAGLTVQGVMPAVPPVSGLDRWLLIALPFLLAVDAGASLLLNARAERLLRLAAAAAVAPVILWGSIHFEVAPELRILPQLTLGGLLTVSTAACVLIMMTAQTHRPCDAHPVLRAGLVILTLQSAAAAVMLGGWIRGGTAALPLAGSGLGILFASLVLQQPLAAAAVIRWSVWSLCGVLLTGHFFGRLSLLQSALLCTAASVPLLVPLPAKSAAKTLRTTIICLLTLLLLVLVLVPAVIAFLSRMQPLLALQYDIRG